MESNCKTSACSDDEEDLEQLRLAALQTIKKPPQVVQNVPLPVPNTYYKKSLPKRGRGFHGNRPPRNGQFISKARITNLIAIPTIEDNVTEKTTPKEDFPKLVRPQDRYCNMDSAKPVDSPESTSKFNRYDKSDSESESELESEHLGSEGSPKKLERTDSLEELMKELENEICDEKPKESVNVGKKKVKKAKKDSQEQKENVEAVHKVNNDSTMVESSEKVVDTKVSDTSGSTEDVSVKVRPHKKLNFSKYNKGNWRRDRKSFPPKNVYSGPPQPFFVPNGTVIPPFPYAPPVLPPEPPIPFPPVNYGRPPSPLTIKTDLNNVPVAAPLSPRSMAFVMENRIAIERRKRSPRRSFSRSPSPRFRRSRSPRRSSLSPNVRTAPKRRSPPVNEKKSSVRERLGSKKKKSRSKSPPQEAVKIERSDPVLEARKRKFETNEIKVKEGVIRLKPKMEETKKEEPEKVDEEELDEILLDSSLDHLFSDEESDEENEGRFKEKTQDAARKTSVLPFTQLLKTAATQKEKSKSSKRLDKSKNGGKESIKKSRSPLKGDKPVPIGLQEKKIEIKIRNPNKYEGSDEKERKEKNVARKVEVGSIFEDSEPEIIIDNEDDDDGLMTTNEVSEGDLRAQLKRKRAERQHKIGLVDGVPSRLLQNALDSAVFKKDKKRSAESNSTALKELEAVKRITNGIELKPLVLFKSRMRKVKILYPTFACGVPDAKLPIHSRLGITMKRDGEGRKKTKKRSKIHAVTEQV